MIFNRIAVFLIQAVSSFFKALAPRACRFHPSCSRYASEAFGRFGFFEALALTAKRLARCQPFCAGGWDPVPVKEAR